MSSAASESAARANRLKAVSGWLARPKTLFWFAIGALTLASLLLRQDGATPDVSWLTSMCGRMLNGERGWIDIFETTPPVPTLLYMPGAWLAKVFGVNSELTVFATTYAATLATLAFMQRLLPGVIEGSGPSRWVVTLPAALFFFVLSDDAFAQREYFAALFSLPIFAVFVRRGQENEWPSARARFIAAALAGLAFAIKPPLFAAPFLAIGAYEWIRTRSLRFLFPSYLPAAALIGVLITAVSLAAFPAYLGGVTTLMRDVYVPIKAGPWHGLCDSFLGTALCLVASAGFSLSAKSPAATKIAGVFALAYVVVYFLQGKYFPYHVQPGALFAFIALIIPTYGRMRGLDLKTPANTAFMAMHAAIVAAAAALLMHGFADGRPKMRDLSWAKGMDHPTAMAIAPNISFGFPLAEHIHARWVDRIHSQLVAGYAHFALDRGGLTDEKRELYQRYFDNDIARTREVIREKRPDLIIQCVSSSCGWLTKAMLAGDPALLNDYAPIAQEGVIRILRRKDANGR